MTARPILFSGPMVRALLDGRKTQTRRIVKPQPMLDEISFSWMKPLPGKRMYACVSTTGTPPPGFFEHCPYGKPGDLLWVREKFNFFKINSDNAMGGPMPLRDIKHRGDFLNMRCGILYGTESGAQDYKMRPSIHMPRVASRLTLEITGVRVERLQDISEADAIAEGTITEAEAYSRWCNPNKINYQYIWEEINGPGSWGDNPWVWVIEFETHKRNVEEVLRDVT